MKVTVEIPDDAFCDDCPFYSEGEDSLGSCNYIALYATDDEESELVEYVKIKGQKREKTVKSDDCPDEIGVAAKRKLTNIKTMDIYAYDDDEDEEEDEDWEDEDELEEEVPEEKENKRKRK